MRNLPTYLIVDVGQSLPRLLKSIDPLGFPTIDVEAILDQLVECLYHKPTIENELIELLKLYLDTDLLSSSKNHSAYDTYIDCYDGDLELDDFARRAIKLGHTLKTLFKELKLFDEDRLCYQHDRIIDERFVILRVRR